MKELHKQAVHRQRRVIYNNDGAETAIYMTEPTAKNFLEQRTTALVGTQVDSLFYCTRASPFGTFTHDTKVGQAFTTTEGRYRNNQTEAMHAAGLDPLQLIVDFSKQHGIEVFWSMRMNDTHDGQRAEYGPIIFRHCKLKKEHPEYMLGTKEKKPKLGSWTAVNYALPEIRDLAYKYVEEVCQNYDIDGVELDFYRHPMYFPSNAKGQRATVQELDMMTDLVRRIRKMTRREAVKRGRPILVAIHCPDSADYCRAMGLDLEAWMERDLFDLWIAGGTFHLNDWDYSAKLAKRHGVKAYASLDGPRVRDDLAKQMRRKPECYRARAVNAWNAGMDGVSMFNMFTVFNAKRPSRLLTHELADLSVLSQLDRDYFASPLGMVNSANRNYPLPAFQKAETLNGRSPKKLKPGGSATARMVIGGRIDPSGEPNLKLRLRFKSSKNTQHVRVRLNGKQLEASVSKAEWIDCAPRLGDVRPGRNEIVLALPKSCNGSLTWVDALLEVRY